VERAQPLGARGEAIFVLEGDSADELRDGLARLLAWLPAEPRPIEVLAREWHRRLPPDPIRKLAVAFVARSVAELKEQIEATLAHLVAHPDGPLADPRSRAFFNP